MRWVAVLMLAGCGTMTRVGPPDQVLPRLADRCGVAEVRPLLGQPFVTLAQYRLPGTLRVLYPGQEVTARVQPTRLNAAVDDATRITGLFCG